MFVTTLTPGAPSLSLRYLATAARGPWRRCTDFVET